MSAQTPRVFNGITETPPGILISSDFPRVEKKLRVTWDKLIQMTNVEAVDDSIRWRNIESIAHRGCFIHVDNDLGIRCMIPEIHPRDKTTYPELAPQWSCRDSKGNWSIYTVKISKTRKKLFEDNLALKKKAEEKKRERRLIPCPSCTFDNRPGSVSCEICFSPLP